MWDRFTHPSAFPAFPHVEAPAWPRVLRLPTGPRTGNPVGINGASFDRDSRSFETLTAFGPPSYNFVPIPIVQELQ